MANANFQAERYQSLQAALLTCPTYSAIPDAERKVCVDFLVLAARLGSKKPPDPGKLEAAFCAALAEARGLVAQGKLTGLVLPDPPAAALPQDPSTEAGEAGYRHKPRAIDSGARRARRKRRMHTPACHRPPYEGTLLTAGRRARQQRAQRRPPMMPKRNSTHCWSPALGCVDHSLSASSSRIFSKLGGLARWRSNPASVALAMSSGSA